MEFREKVNNIFKNRINIDFEKNNELKNEKLLGNRIRCPVRELVLILLDLESALEINIRKDYVKNNYFDTYESILKIVGDSLKKDNYQTSTLVN